jgi:DNA mismatch repair protein MutH
LKQQILNKPPDSEEELMTRAEKMAGKTLFQIAQTLNVNVPDNQSHHKGWTGQLAELYLGATASNLAEPDFQNIGVELKTIPMAKNGTPKESTYICTVNLTNTAGINWETSVIKKKLTRVLWLPVESDNNYCL